MYSNTQDNSQNYNFSHTKNNTTASVKIPVDNIAYAHSGMYDGTKNFVYPIYIKQSNLSIN